MLLAVVSACGSSSPRRPPPPSTTLPATTSTTLRTTTLTASLTGAAVVPGPGSPSASGQARLTLDPDAGQVCWEVTTSGVDAPNDVHLHTAPLGAVGPVRAPLGLGTGCAALPPDLIGSMVANPRAFYVDVLAAAFPRGALRGQFGP